MKSIQPVLPHGNIHDGESRKQEGIGRIGCLDAVEGARYTGTGEIGVDRRVRLSGGGRRRASVAKASSLWIAHDDSQRSLPQPETNPVRTAEARFAYNDREKEVSGLRSLAGIL